MVSVSTEDWFYEFEYNGETKRIHKFEHVPFDMAMDMRKRGDVDVLTVLEELLRRDCGLSLSDFDMDSMSELVDKLAEGGDGLGE